MLPKSSNPDVLVDSLYSQRINQQQDTSFVSFNQKLHHKTHLSLNQSKNEINESPPKNISQSASASKNGNYTNYMGSSRKSPVRRQEKSLSQEAILNKSQINNNTSSSQFTMETLQHAQGHLKAFHKLISSYLEEDISPGKHLKPFDTSSKIKNVRVQTSPISKNKELPFNFKVVLRNLIDILSNIEKLEVKENEVVKNIQYENQILEKQILMLLKEKGGSKERLKLIEDTQERVLLDHQYKDLSKLKVMFKKQLILITESQEESEIYKISGELLAHQLDNLQYQINTLMKENLRLKEMNRDQLDKLNMQEKQSKELAIGINVIEDSKLDLQQQVQAQTNQIDQLKEQIATQVRKSSLVVAQPDIPKIDESQHLYIVQQLQSEMIEYKIEASKHMKVTDILKGENSLLKSSVTRLQQEKATVQKSCDQQIQKLTTEKDKIANQQKTQISELTKKQDNDQHLIQEQRADNAKLQKELTCLQQELDSYRQIEVEMSHRKQSSLQKDQQSKKYLQEIKNLKEELNSAQSQLDQRINEAQKQNDTIRTLELSKDQMVYEVSEFQRQLQESSKQEKEKQAETSSKDQKDQENLLQEEIEKIYQQNKNKMIQMKSKLLGLKTNIEKHGEQMGVQSRQSGHSQKTPQEIAHEAQFQFQLIMEELYKLIDQMNDLQKAIDVDYGNKFTKMNDKQRVLIAQNFQLRLEVKKIDKLEEYNKEMDKQMEQLKEKLRLVTIEYKEYKDIMKTKFSDLNRGYSKTIEISEEDKNETTREKQIDKLKQTAKEYETKNQMLKSDLQAAQQQIQMMAQMTAQNLPPDYFQQMCQQQDEGMVRSAARTIQQNSLELKQSDILNKKINELSEKLSQKTLESQKHSQEYSSLKDTLKQEKLEWVSQLEKRDKQYKILEERYKKCLEQFEELQQKYFVLENANDGHKNSSGSDSD